MGDGRLTPAVHVVALSHGLRTSMAPLRTYEGVKLGAGLATQKPAQQIEGEGRPLNAYITLQLCS